MPGPSQSSQLDDDTLTKLSSHVIVLLMSKAGSKIPVKRADIVKIALSEHPRSYDVVLRRVEEDVQFFSLKLVKIDHPTKSVMLVNSCKDMYNYNKKTQEEKAQGVLLLLVLSFIFMRNNSVREDILWDYLEKLEIVKEDTRFIHDYFGDARKIVSKVFVRQMYLDCCKVPNSDPVCHEYSFGKRALVEISKRNLLEFVCKMYGSDNLGIFRSHLEMVVREEEERGDRVSIQEATVPASGETRHQSDQAGPSSKTCSASQSGPPSQRHSDSQLAKRSSSQQSKQADTSHLQRRRKH